jgi:hypothetical protein
MIPRGAVTSACVCKLLILRSNCVMATDRDDPNRRGYSRSSARACRDGCTRHSLRGGGRAGIESLRDAQVGCRSTIVPRERLSWLGSESSESDTAREAWPRSGGRVPAGSDRVHGRTGTRFWRQRNPPYNRISADGGKSVNWLSQPWGPPQTAPTTLLIRADYSVAKRWARRHWTGILAAK